MMAEDPLLVIFAASVTIACSKRLRFTVMWFSRSSDGSDAASGKEGRRDAWNHVIKDAIFSSHRNSAACAVVSVYDEGGKR